MNFVGLSLVSAFVSISATFLSVYVGVVDYSSFMQISTVVIANVDVCSSSFDDSHSDKCESTLIIAVDWQQR
jgi:hypothetical protein